MGEVQVTDIEKELDKLWGARGDHRVRASLFNLVVYSQEAARLPFLQEIIKATIAKFPCRILLIQNNNDPKDDSLNVFVSDELTKVGDVNIACDQIVIKTSPKQLHRVPFIVLPHILPDLPIYLLWGHNPTKEATFLPQALPFASRLIFDSDCVEDLPKFSADMLALIKANPCIEVMDVNWVRIEDWRNAMRQIFSSTICLEHLRQTHGILVKYCSKQSATCRRPELPALYFAGWLSGQMGWKEKSRKYDGGRWEIVFFNGKNDFTMTLSPQEYDKFSLGTIVEVEVIGMDDHSFLIAPVPKTSKVVVHITSRETCELPFSLSMPSFKNGFPFISELMFDTTSQHYKNMLKNFSSFGAKE